MDNKIVCNNKLLQTKKDEHKNKTYTKYPIYIYQGGIIDGWHRHKVCNELGIEPVYIEFQGGEIDAINFVIRTNNKRNLTSSQWAAIAVDAEEIIKIIEEDTERMRRKKQSESLSETHKSGIFGVCDNKLSQTRNEHINAVHTKVAELFTTNRTYINNARNIKEKSPDIFERVKSGEKTITEVKKDEKVENSFFKCFLRYFCNLLKY